MTVGDTQFLSASTEPKPTDVADVARNSVRKLAAEFPAATISLEAEGPVVALAAAPLERAVEELVRNSIVHTDSDTPTVEVTVTQSAEGVAVTVADDGPGIPEIEYGVFELEAVSDIDHDTGYGLNLAYWIVRRSGGQLEFSDNEPRGSRVTMHRERPGTGR